ncbi:MAG: glutamine-hydrolyzing carbamoyl-phosphate synthase small subunit [Candidatus Micrarchaeota archaeon]
MVVEGAANSLKHALLVLSDGTFFAGEGIGCEKTVFGEAVFNTGMTGFQEALTDPSYAGQILAFSYPLIGNYGVSESAFESGKVQAAGCVVREACVKPVHYASKKNLNAFLEENDAPGIAGIDTRALVRKIRSAGVMPAALSVFSSDENFEEKAVELAEKSRKFDYSALNFVAEVSSDKKTVLQAKNEKKKIALVDYGAKSSIARELLKRDCTVVVFPWNATAQEILAEGVDGVMLSNGPGDPSVLVEQVQELKTLVGKKPVFGICLGHQLLATALGAKTFKLKFGHRGCNHAVVENETRKVLITSQNHGFAVGNLPSSCADWFSNCNDGTNEGLRHNDLPIMSVQFHPEASPGPQDANFLFDEFLKMV